MGHPATLESKTAASKKCAGEKNGYL